MPPQIIKKLIERKQAQIRKVYPGLSCFKEGVRQIPVESVPGIREQGSWLKGQEGILRTWGRCSEGCFFPLCRRDRLEATGKGEGVSVQLRGMFMGMGVGDRRAQTSHLVSLISSKELKDPDQLYTTLKNLLAQIKVGGQGPLVSN